MLNRVLDEEVRIQVGPLEYQVLVPDFVRRQVQDQYGQEITLHTNEYLDGNPMQGRVVPHALCQEKLRSFRLREQSALSLPSGCNGAPGDSKDRFKFSISTLTFEYDYAVRMS